MPELKKISKSQLANCDQVARVRESELNLKPAFHKLTKAATEARRKTDDDSHS